MVADNTSIIVIPEISTNTTPSVIEADFNSSIGRRWGLENDQHTNTFCHVVNLPHELSHVYMFEQLLYLLKISTVRAPIQIRATYFRNVSCCNVILGGNESTNPWILDHESCNVDWLVGVAAWMMLYPVVSVFYWQHKYDLELLIIYIGQSTLLYSHKHCNTSFLYILRCSFFKLILKNKENKFGIIIYITIVKNSLKYVLWCTSTFCIFIYLTAVFGLTVSQYIVQW